MYLRPILHSLRSNSLKYAASSIHNISSSSSSNTSLLRHHGIWSNVVITTSPTQRQPISSPTPSANIVSLRHSSSTTGASSSSSSDTNIYYGTLTPKIRAVKVFSLTTSVVGLTIQPMLIEQGTKLGGMPMVVFMCGFAGLFTFVTPLLLHFVTKKYVTEIAYNAASDEYTATTISFFLVKKKVR